MIEVIAEVERHKETFAAVDTDAPPFRVSIVLYVMAFLMFFTGLTGFCLLYKIFKINTLEIKILSDKKITWVAVFLQDSLLFEL